MNFALFKLRTICDYERLSKAPQDTKDSKKDLFHMDANATFADIFDGILPTTPQ